MSDVAVKSHGSNDSNIVSGNRGTFRAECGTKRGADRTDPIGSLESGMAHGPRSADERLATLKSLSVIWPIDFKFGTDQTIAILERQLVILKQRGLSGHWTYSLPQHTAAINALILEKLERKAHDLNVAKRSIESSLDNWSDLKVTAKKHVDHPRSRKHLPELTQLSSAMEDVRIAILDLGEANRGL